MDRTLMLIATLVSWVVVVAVVVVVVGDQGEQLPVAASSSRSKSRTMAQSAKSIFHDVADVVVLYANASGSKLLNDPDDSMSFKSWSAWPCFRMAVVCRAQ
ncbi:hypothetical protein H257_16458 [Aphanomyces astaci]|uniref:Uncharacterized protein n=1 Tax=Aphanomyces astaci TaxID=112090 RepID=W4FKX5_APHAT|nr:hypothetical protein H257_16458 [Aphanomyces astaci]ETV67373.1 hypothetical protein H257_16458 [Aphanomyces astaci]|eukprot:XP_009843188.1 hypothetical protein H257_16458 [Aphanomyces astaci]